MKPTFLLFLLTCCASTDSDGSAESDAGTALEPEPETAEPEPSAAEPEPTPQPDTPREGPEGCYLPDQHACDCEAEEDECEDIEGIWTTGCNSCVEATADAGSVATDAGAVAGDAGLVASDAGSVATDAGSVATDAASSVPDAAGPGSTMMGCYMPEQHQCDCALDESVCDEVSGIWTDGCDSCAATPDDAGSDPEDASRR